MADGAHEMNALEFFQRVPKLVVRDNLKARVAKACRCDLNLNPTYQEWALHNGVGVVARLHTRLRRDAVRFSAPAIRLSGSLGNTFTSDSYSPRR